MPGTESITDAKAIYNDAIVKIKNANWRELSTASEAGKAAGVPVYLNHIGYQHVYDSYFGQQQSVYTTAA